MKNKTIFLFLTTIFPMLFLTCQKAELPTIGRALLTLQVEATENQISMSADIESSGDLEIYERGFIYNYPIYKDGHWRREEAKYIVEKQKSFEKHLNDIDYQIGMYCEIYAYISTNYGRFKSETKRIDIDDRPEPIITSIIQDPISKTMVIKGSGFTKHKNWIQLWVIDHIDRKIYFNIKKSTPTEIEVDYSEVYKNIKYIGKHPINLIVDNKKCKSESYFEIEGAYLEKIEPNPFIIGEDISLHLRNFKSNDEFMIEIDNYYNSDWIIKSIKDNSIKLCISPSTDNFTICFLDKNYKRSELSVSIYEPWEQIDILDNMIILGSHQEKLYGFCRENSTLYIYDPLTRTTESNIFEPIVQYKNSDEFSIKMFGTDEYLYFIIQLHDLNGLQKIYRLNQNKYTWKKMNNSPNQPIVGPIIVSDLKNIYAKHFFKNEQSQEVKEGYYTYHLDTDIWEEAFVKYDSMPIGIYNDSIYYLKNSIIYRTDPNNPEKREYITKLNFETVYSNFYMQNQYIYFKNHVGLYRINVSFSPIKYEALGGRDFTGTFIPTKSGLYFCWDNKIYRYTDELKMD
mgnify:CR=1 FL=1